MIRPRGQLAVGLLISALLAIAVSLTAEANGIVDVLEERAVAARFEVRGASTPSDFVVVAIDDVTFDELSLQWPFPRSEHAKAIDVLRRAGAREIVYDVQFTEKSTQREDGALYTAVDRAGGAVLATSESDARGRTDVLGGDENLTPIGARAAAANLPDGRGGIISRFPRATGRLPSLAIVTAERTGGPRLAPSAFGGEGAWIDFRGPPGTIKTVSFSALRNGRVDPAVLRDRIVVVGATAPSLGDIHATPTASAPMAGPEIQANAIWTALHGLPLRDAPRPIEVALVILAAFVVPLLRLKLRILPAALAGPGLAVALAVGAQVAFEQGVVVWVAAPLTALAIATVATIVVSHLLETRARRRIARDNDVLEARVRERTRELRETQLEILQRLSRAAEWRDGDTGRHVVRMGELSRRLGLALGMSRDEAEMLGHAATAHDIGKIAIRDSILGKAAPLTHTERAEMERHPEIGASMLDASRSPVIQAAEEIARTHHERWDGAGYPVGLRGDKIPLSGRICALCDVFDALVSERAYKEAWTLDAALTAIRAESGTHFDPELVEAFCTVAQQSFADLYGVQHVVEPEDDGLPVVAAVSTVG